MIPVVIFRHEGGGALRLAFAPLVPDDDEGFQLAAVDVAEVDVVDVVDDLAVVAGHELEESRLIVYNCGAMVISSTSEPKGSGFESNTG